MTTRSGFIDAHAFDGMLAGMVLVGLIAGMVIIGIPGYFLGRHQGYEKAMDEAKAAGVLVITYDAKDGHKIETWRKP